MAEGGDAHQAPAHRRVRAALLVSGLRWRARSSLVMFAVAVFAAGAAAFGPIYLRSADQLTLEGTLSSASRPQTGLTLAASPHRRTAPAVARLEALARAAPEPRSTARWWGAPIATSRATFLTVPTIPQRTASSSVAAAQAPSGPRGAPSAGAGSLPYGPTHPFRATLVARTGACAHLDIVSGRCSDGTGVVVSSRTARLLGLTVGGTFPVRFRHASSPVAPQVVGIYRPRNPYAAYWWGRDDFSYGTILPRLTALVEVDDVFTTASGIRALAPGTDVTSTVQVPYRQGSLTTGAVADFETSLAAFEQATLGRTGVVVRTDLSVLLAHAGGVEHAATTVVGVADLELVLLGILVLYFVASRTASERAPDVRLAELRGFRSRSAIAVALTEPLAIVPAAVPIGLAAAWLVAGATAPAVFGPGVGVSVTALAIAAAIAAGVAGIVAAALGARRSLTGGIGADDGADPGRRSRRSVLADAAVVALAGAAFFELAVSGDSGSGPTGADPLAALAPGLLAVALAVLAARLVPPLLRAAHRRTACSPRVGTAFAIRTVARRREHAAQLVLAALAVALATFAVSGWAVAIRNRDLRAALSVGAPKVLTVSVRPGVTFVRAVRAADPSGHHAMAAVVEHAKDGTTLALDVRRLASVATWPPDLGVAPADVARILRAPHVAPEVFVKGSALAAVVGTDLAGRVQPAPRLVAGVFDVDTQLLARVTLGSLRNGTHRYAARLGRDCLGECRLVSLSLTWTPAVSRADVASTPPSITVHIDRLAERVRGAAWTTVPAGVTDPRRWSGTPGAVRLSSAGRTLAAHIRLNYYGAPVTIEPADVPHALPVLTTPESNSTASGDYGPLVVGLDGQTLPGHRVGVVPALPGVPANAVLVDLPAAERFLGGPFKTESTEVWLSTSAAPGIVRRLRAQGVEPVGARTAAGAVAALSRSGLNVAYLLYLICAVAAALLAVATTAFTLASAARRRQGELAALRAVGVPARALRRAVRVEQLLVLGTGFLTGVLAGVVSAVVALRSVPEFVSKTPGPPLELGLPPGDLAVALGALVLALAAVVFAGSAGVVRGATVDRLAGAQQS